MDKMRCKLSYLLFAFLIVTSVQFAEVRHTPETVDICEQIDRTDSDDIFIEYKGVSGGGSGTCMCNVTRADEGPKIEIKTKDVTILCGRRNCMEGLLLRGPDGVPDYNSCTNNTGIIFPGDYCVIIGDNKKLLDHKGHGGELDSDEQINITFRYSNQNALPTPNFQLEIKVDGGGSKIDLHCSHAADEWPSTMSEESSPSTLYDTSHTTLVTQKDVTGTDSTTPGADQSTIRDGNRNPSINIGLVAGLSAGGVVVVVGIILLVVFIVKKRKEKPTTQSKLSDTPRLNKSNGTVDGFGTELVDNTTYANNTDLKTVPSDTDLVDNLQYSVGTFKDPDFYSEATEIHDNPTYGSDPITPTNIYTDDTQLVDNNTYTDISDKEPDPIQSNPITLTGVYTDDTQLVDNDMYTDISDKQPDPIQSNPITLTGVYTDDTQLVENNTYTDISAKQPPGGPLYLDLHD